MRADNITVIYQDYHASCVVERLPWIK